MLRSMVQIQLVGVHDIYYGPKSYKFKFLEKLVVQHKYSEMTLY